MNNQVNIPILYSFRRCPFAMRTRAVLFFSKIDVILREVVLRNKPKKMLIASEKGTVPVLILKDKVIDESLEIIIWALNIRDDLNLLEPYKKEKKNVLKLIYQIDNEFKFHLDRYKYSSRYLDAKDFKGKNFHRDIAANYLHDIEKKLKENSNLYLYNNKLSVVDLSIFPLIRQFRIANEKWFDENPKFSFIQKWLNNILELDFYKVIMKKYKPWTELSAPEIFTSNLKV